MKNSKSQKKPTKPGNKNVSQQKSSSVKTPLEIQTEEPVNTEKNRMGSIRGNTQIRPDDVYEVFLSSQHRRKGFISTEDRIFSISPYVQRNYFGQYENAESTGNNLTEFKLSTVRSENKLRSKNKKNQDDELKKSLLQGKKNKKPNELDKLKQLQKEEEQRKKELKKKEEQRKKELKKEEEERKKALKLEEEKRRQKEKENQKDINGTCILIRAAEGSLREEQTLKGSTASFDCFSDYIKEEEDDFTELKLKNVTITSLNDDEPKDKIVDANAAFKINIMKEEKAKSKYDEEDALYVFEQNYQTCKCKDGIANFKLKGTIENYKDKEIKGEIYTLTTSENNDAKCNLTKEANSDEVTLDCQVETSTEKFDFITGEDTETNSESSIALEMNDDSVLCSESNGSSSSSGLSGGAVAGIVIGSIAGVLVLAGIAVLVAFAVKTTGAAAAAAAAGTISSAGSEAAFPTSSFSSNKIPV